jgi:hypothetical protein
MISDKQNTLYWRMWSRVVNANDWRMSKGRLISPLAPHTSHLGRRVLALATDLARQLHRSVTADDLRHACHVAAVGHEKSHKDLTNTEFSRVLTAFKLLIEPDDLDAQMDWDNPDRDARRSLVAGINKIAPHAAIDAICKNAFNNYNSPFWEDLELGQLRWLLRTLKDCASRRLRPIRAAANFQAVPVGQDDNNPF